MKKIISETFRCGNCIEFLPDGNQYKKMGQCRFRQTLVFSNDSFCSAFDGQILVRQVKQITSLLNSKTPFCIVQQLKGN